MAFSALTIDLTARLARFESEMNKATASINKFGQTGDRIANGFKATFATLGASVAAGAFVAFAKNTVDAADALNDMSKRTGVTVKDLDSLRTISEQSGTSLDGLAQGIQRLNLASGEARSGNAEMAKALKALGVNAKDPLERFYQLADAVKNGSDADRTAVNLKKVLSKSYADLLPVLSEGGQALRNAAQASESFAESMARLAPDADKFNDQFAQIKTNAAEAAAVILSDLLPVMNGFLQKLIDFSSLKQQGFGGVFDQIKLGISPLLSVKENLDSIQQAIKQTEDALARGDHVSVFGFGSVDEYLKKAKAVRAVLIDIAVNRDNAINPSGGNEGRGSDTSLITTKSDPLGPLLDSTEVAKVDQFEKLMGLLNARLAAGKISAEQYRQASEKLFSNTFAADIAAINKQLEYNAETERLVAEHLQATNDALDEQKQAWIDAGKAIEEEMLTPAEKLSQRLAYLDELFRRGVLGVEAYHRAYSAAFDEGNVKLGELDEFAKNAAKSIQDAFADFLFDPFAEGLDGMLQGFADMIQRMVAQAIAAQLARHLFGDLVSGGTGEGVLGGIFKSVLGGLVGSANGNVFMNAPALSAYSGSVVSKPTLFPFAHGIGLMGEAGAEAILPLKRGNDGKLGVAGGGGVQVTNYFSVSGPVDRRAEQRVAAAVYQSVVRASRRNS